MGNVIELNTVTTAAIPPEKILQAALKAELTEAIVIGQKPDGTVYFAMSTAEVPSVNWLLDCAKRLLMDGIIEDEGCHG
jgi:hypothetical protein